MRHLGENTLVCLDGGKGIGKTHTIVGKKARDRPLGVSHVGVDCLATRCGCREIETLKEIKDGDVQAESCRQLLIGEKLAYLWSFDGHHNELGYAGHLLQALVSNHVIVDSWACMNLRTLTRVVAAGHKILVISCSLPHADRVRNLERRRAEAPNKHYTNSSEQWAGRLPDNVSRLQEALGDAVIVEVTHGGTLLVEVEEILRRRFE